MTATSTATSMVPQQDATAEYPLVQGGGSLMIAWQIKGKRVLVVGGGEVAAGRILHCLNADARVTVVCPSSGLTPEVAYRIAAGQARHIDRCFEPSDIVVHPTSPSTPVAEISAPSPPLSPLPATVITAACETTPKVDAPRPTPTPTPTPAPSDITITQAPHGDEQLVDMVLVAIDDPAASTEIWQLCRARRVVANIADVPPECDFYFGSVHRDGPLQVMVSTNGRGPRLAAQIRKWIAGRLPKGAGGAIETIGKLRGMLRAAAPGPAEGPKRMGWMAQASDSFTWEELGEFTDEDVDNLLRFYHVGTVPSLGDIRSMRKDDGNVCFGVFDGSFGFAVGV